MAELSCNRLVNAGGDEALRVAEHLQPSGRSNLHSQHRPLSLPYDHSRHGLRCYRAASIGIVLADAVVAGVTTTAELFECDLATALQAAWAVVLHRLSGQGDIPMGVTSGSRAEPRASAVTLPVEDDPSAAELLRRVKLAVWRSQPGPSAVSVSQVVPPLDVCPSIRPQVLFEWGEGFADDAECEEMTPELRLCLQPSGSGVRGTIWYATELFERTTVQRWLGHFSRAVDSIAQDPQHPISRVVLLTESERREIIESFNATTTVYPEAPIHQLFEECAAGAPQAVAVTLGGVDISYAELNGRANQMAHHLRAHGIAAGEFVPVIMPRGLPLLIVQIAILKSGGAYVPLDPEVPPERLSFLIGDCGARYVLTDGQVAAERLACSAQVIDCAVADDLIATYPRDNLNLHVQPRAPAYVMYTSGSTGTPKGVVVPHCAVLRLVINNGYARIERTDCIAHYSNPSFDASTFEVWGALLNGARVLLVPQSAVLVAREFAELLKSQRVTVLWMSVGLFNQYTDTLAGVFARLRYLIVGGDVLEPQAVRRVLRNNPPQHFLNGYGPTECTTFSTTHVIDAVEDAAHSLPIGRPIANTHVHILDKHGEPVPIGAAGEIYIGGAGVACGYLNRPELTAERFVADSFGMNPHGRLYRTGDMGRRRADGVIEFLGRNDHQVKIRGFRIEPAEIEAQLLRDAQIGQALVVAQDDGPGDKRLLAYIVPRDVSGAPTVDALRAHLRSVLPDYMVPSAFVILERLPLSTSGKVDRRALPPPPFDAYTSAKYDAPRNAKEQLLADLWQELLGMERVGREDNFLELGGDSLLIVQMLERLHQLRLATTVQSVFDCRTLADLATTLTREDQQDAVPANLIPSACGEITPSMLPLVELTSEQIASIVRSVPGGATGIQDIYPLAPLQEGMLFHHLLTEQRGDTYVISIPLEVCSQERVRELVSAIQAVIDRHDVLRTAILWKDLPRPVQIVHRRAELPVVELPVDLNRDPLRQIADHMSPERQWLDLRVAPLMRLYVATDPSADTRYVLLQLHHIICDHIALDEVTAEVVMHLEGRVHELRNRESYRNHVVRALARAQEMDSEAFFREKLRDVEEPTIPFGLRDVHGDGTQVAEACESLDAALAQRLRAQARRLGVSPAALFHAAWALVTARSAGRDDVVFGTVLLGRLAGAGDEQRAIGLFINTLPLRLRVCDATAQQLVEQTQRELAELLVHEQASLAIAQRCSGVDQSSPLFSTLLNYVHVSASRDADWSTAAGIRALPLQERTNYPITVSIDDLERGFRVKAQTDQRVDPQRIIGYVRMAVSSLTEALERAPATPAIGLPVLPDEERDEILRLFNATRLPYPKDKLMHELFEEQVRRTPEALAVSCANQQVTYSQLNAKANQLARWLRRRGVGPERIVGLCIDRGIDMVVALLGILKSGGAYLPLDASYPQERLQHLIRDASPLLIVTEQQRQDRVAAYGVSTTVLDVQASEINAEPESDLPRASGAKSSNLAYVIYTSGSTGLPKGVAIEHLSAVNLLWWARQAIAPECFAQTLCSTSLNFDLSVYECFVPLSVGGCLRVVPNALALSSEPDTTLVNTVPSAMRAILDSTHVPPTTRVVNLAGEPLSEDLVNRIFERSGVASVCNLYGPSETTTYSTWVMMTRERGFVASIGRPIANTQIYILNDRRELVPIGAIGEIYIGGAGVARGYLNRPELTAERFLPDPISGDPVSRLYRTGDLGRWQADGTIEYLGRNDHQVKIRGMRIELGEIEAQLARHARVRDVVVLAREDVVGDRRLVAYFTSDDQIVPILEELRTRLKGVLPEYMIPSAFVQLETMPLTSNGKLDRRALPAPDQTAYASREYEPPSSGTEETVARVWQDLLGVERVGRHDNFFELGGHSLLIVQMVERLRRVDLSAAPRQVFATPTLASLARTLGTGQSAMVAVPPNLIPPECQRLTPDLLPLIELEVKDIERIAATVPDGVANIQDVYPLAPLQEGILFHHLLQEDGGDAYLLQIMLRVSSQERLDALITALQATIDRHDVLRTAVLWERLPQPLQVVYRHARLRVEHEVLEPGEDLARQLEQWAAPERQRLRLQNAPLLRLRVASCEDGFHFAMVQFHHITVDHLTFEIINSEIVAHLAGQAWWFDEAETYRAHVARVLAHRRMNDAAAFFRSKLTDVEEPTAPFGLLDVHSSAARIAEAREDVDPELARRIRLQARRMGVGAATVFHAAWSIVVAHLSSRDDVVFGTLLMGRLQGEADTQNVLGLFINTLPVRIRLDGMSVKTLMEQTQRELVELLNHEQASLAEAQRCSAVAGSVPLFTSLLNYRHSRATIEDIWSGVNGIELRLVHDRTNYPLVMSVDDLGGGFKLHLQVDPQVEPRRVLGYMQTALSSLVEALENAPHTQALSLSVLPEPERHHVLEHFAAQRVAMTPSKLLHELFEEQVSRTPHAVAAVCMGVTLTYAQLESRANQLAHHLRARGVGPGSRVALCVERSLEMVVSIVGVLKAGGAYVPLDPSYPAERLDYMLKDAAPRVVITQRPLRERMTAADTTIVMLDDDSQEIVAQPDGALDREASLTCNELAYIIYTSGSTGQPKGVMVEHRNVTRLFTATAHWFRFTERDVWTLFHSYAFDFSVWELWGALLHGARLVVVPRVVARSTDDFYRLLCDEGVTVLNQTPSAFTQLVEAQARGSCERMHALRVVIFGGEALDLRSLQPWIRRNGPDTPELVNMYGITETTVHVTCHRLTAEEIEYGKSSPIGEPIPDLRLYVLDARLQPVPFGVAGEIYVGGAGVARGYLNRPELTATRFISDPYSADGKARLYRTGDLAVWRKDGVLEYRGRNDEQVKIRGFRIELGEIAAHVVRHKRVKDAVVITRQDSGDKQLVAYVIPTDPSQPPSAEELRAHLRNGLPDYMVPGAFVVIENMPLTLNGKLDRRALPAPQAEEHGDGSFEEPQTEDETMLAQIWHKLLNVNRIGRDDNFFDLGGHSLLAMRVAAHVLSQTSIELPIRMIFEFPTIRHLGAQITVSRRAHFDGLGASDPGEMRRLLDLVTSMSEDEVRSLIGDV